MKKIGVLGTGTMGAGIIQVLAQNGYEVVMRARRETSIEKGLATIKKNLDKMVAKERMTADEAAAVFYRCSNLLYRELWAGRINAAKERERAGVCINRRYGSKESSVRRTRQALQA